MEQTIGKRVASAALAAVMACTLAIPAIAAPAGEAHAAELAAGNVVSVQAKSVYFGLQKGDPELQGKQTTALKNATSAVKKYISTVKMADGYEKKMDTKKKVLTVTYTASDKKLAKGTIPSAFTKGGVSYNCQALVRVGIGASNEWLGVARWYTADSTQKNYSLANKDKSKVAYYNVPKSKTSGKTIRLMGYTIHELSHKGASAKIHTTKTDMGTLKVPNGYSLQFVLKI